MKGLLATLVVLVLVALAADRIGVAVAQRAVATQLQESGELSMRPSVEIGGFPFLTQAVSGRYDSVRVRASDVSAGSARFSTFDATLRGLHVPLADAVSGDVESVPVDALSASVVLTYAELEKRLRDRRLALSPGPDGLLRVTGSVTVLGRTLSASALSSVALDGTEVVVTAKRFQVGAAPADRVLTAALGNRLDFRARLGTLPYGLRLTGVRIQPEGVVAVAAAKGVTLSR